MKLLKKEYKRRSQLRPLFWDNTIQLPIEQVYTRLKIISRGKLAIQRKDDDVNVFDIFKVPEIGEDVMTIVEGSPGIGKTTFCLKLAYDWAHGNIPSECSFPKFEFVFLLKCRDIDGDIMEAISEQLLPRKMEKSVENLLHLMKDIHNQERLILIILDGLDELPEKSRHDVDELLHRRILPFCYVLATSRQERGIEVRKSVVFDIHLEIKGYKESDSIAYVRRHFEAIGQSPKGEKLIEEMQQNTFLHALRNNPLNLLLLCVIFEDYDGELPTSRTELYQVIVHCLLRRYCARHCLPLPKDTTTLQKQFEEDVLALGELAWACLLSNRQSFREGELTEREVRNENLVARKIGLLYMEESLKRVSPQHEYWFLHKTFQEYLSAKFITHKLQRGELNVFEYTTFDDLVRKYPQVFVFVSGMLGENATVLFSQIGENLKMKEDWDWNVCSQQASTFFVESLSESGHAELMATTLCGIIPFPEIVFFNEHKGDPFAELLIFCENFSTLQTPVELKINFNSDLMDDDLVLCCIESLAKLKSVSLEVFSPPLDSTQAGRIPKWLSASKSLSEFTFKESWDHDGYVPVLLCDGLALCKTLTKVKFIVSEKESEDYINAVRTSLSVSGTPLTSAVVLVIYGSMRSSSIYSLQKLLENRSLISLSLHICGDVQDLLAAAVSEALARETVLKSFDLRLGGTLSSAGASSLQKGLIKNSSLHYIKVAVCGELPDNWQSVVETLYSTKKSRANCAIYPNTINNIARNHVGLVLAENALVPKQHLTVNVWGKLSCEGAETLCEVLIHSSPAFKLLTLNVHGNVTEDVANSVGRCLTRSKMLSSLSINIWGNLTPEGGIILSGLSGNNLGVHLNAHHMHLAAEESNQVLDISFANPTTLKAFSAKVKDREKVSLILNNDSDVSIEWMHYLGGAFAENASLISLDLTVNTCLMDADLVEGLGESLLQSTSIKTVRLIINCSDVTGWVCTLGACFAKMASLTTLNLELNDYGEGSQVDFLAATQLSNVLVAIKPLSTLSVSIHSVNMVQFWIKVVVDCLRKCASLKNLSLAFNTDSREDYFDGIDDGLAKTTSLDTLTLAIDIDDSFQVFLMEGYVFERLNNGLALNSSLTTLTITVSLMLMESFNSGLSEDYNVFNYCNANFVKGLSRNKSITTLNLTINELFEVPGNISDITAILIVLGLFEGLAQNTSITTLNLTLNCSKEVSDVCFKFLFNALDKNCSLTTLRLKVNNHCTTVESRLYDLRKLVIQSESLSLLELEVSFYGKENE